MTVATNILSALETLGFEESSEIQPIKLKTGYGEEVCKILIFILEKIFEAKKLVFRQPVFPKPDEEKAET